MNPTETVTQIGKYKILAVLGRGGMGVVYRAEDKFIGREVAIKTLVDATPEMRQRFAIEARSGVLNHPNVVTIYDFGEHEGNPYIVMEFLHGHSLDAIVKEGQPLSLVDKLDIVRQVCEGLGYAHSRGVVHRDIKPANIVVMGNGLVKLVDFGIAQLETLSGHTTAGSVIGTYQYLSPERLKGEPSDGRADIWAAGVVLYLLLTGKLPFPGEDISALHRVITDAYPPLGTLLSTAYPASLDNIIARALAKYPSQRYPTAIEMAGDLESTRDAIRLSRMEDLLGQVRSLIDRDELLRARPLLLDLQRLAPQNTAVRNMLRELGHRLQQPLEPVNGARLAESPSPLLNGTGVPDPERLAAMQEEERRRRIIAQIVIEIRGQAERGNQERALQLVQRSLERAPQNSALLKLQAEIEAMIAVADPATMPAAKPVAALATHPAAEHVAAPPPEPVAEYNAARVTEPVAAPAEPLEEAISQPVSLPAGSLGESGQEPALPLQQDPIPQQVQHRETDVPALATPERAADLLPPPAEPDELRGPDAPAAAPEPPQPAFSRQPPAVAKAAKIPPVLVSPMSKPLPPAPAQPAIAAAGKVHPLAKPALEPKLLVVASAAPTARIPIAVPVPVTKPPAAPTRNGPRSNRSVLLVAATAVAALLAAVLFFALRRHATPAPVPVTYAQIVATPYAHVLRLTQDGGTAVTLPSGDNLTPLRVNDLPAGSYTLDLQTDGGPVTQTHCHIDGQQHLCYAELSPLSDADVQTILNGGSHP